jgi:hypothetical protein
MLAFTDSQLRTVWAAATRVPIEKRGVFLERVVARLAADHEGRASLVMMSSAWLRLAELVEKNSES